MNRINKIQDTLQKDNYSGIFIAKPEDVYYLSGFIGTNGRLYITPRRCYLITDFRYLRSAQRQVPSEVSVIDQRDGLGRLMKQALKVGVEAETMTLARFQQLKKAFPKVRFKAMPDFMSKERMIKETCEIKLMKKAVSISASIFESFIQQIKIGDSELELLKKLTMLAFEHGVDGFSFPPIICFGSHTADVHHTLNPNRRLRKSEKILFDYGIRFNGYCTDMTRMIYTAEPSKVEQKIYATVLKANEAGIRAVGVGAKCSDIDRATRSVIESEGFGSYFGHSTGHGVGLEIHEEPRISEVSTDIILPGMLFTVEPGIYSDKFKGGVRIEDMIYVNERGKTEILTGKVDKKLRII